MKELNYSLNRAKREEKTNTRNGLNKLEGIKEKIEDIIAFFAKDDLQQGARLYFEMRIGTMLSPFSNLFHFINKTAKAPKAVTLQMRDYLSANPSLSLDGLFQMLDKSLTGKTKELKIIFGQLTHFSILIREFTLLYGTKRDYLNEFGGHLYRTNILDFHKKGNVIVLNLLHFLASKRNAQSEENVDILAGYYIRETIFNDYRLSKAREGGKRLAEYHLEYKEINNKVEQLTSLAIQAIPLMEELPKVEFDNIPLARKLRAYYQTTAESDHLDLEEIKNILKKIKHRSIGFELEFNSGSGTKDRKALAENYQKALAWENLYSSPHKDMYKPDSDGLLYCDATLPQRYDAQKNTIGCPLEYSSPPFTLNDDKDKYTSFLNIIGQESDAILYSNSETHQHIYAKDINLAGMKRLVLRRAWHDKIILEAFHVPEKRHDLNRSACALLTNISSHTTEQERIRNYIIFSGLVNSATDIPTLKQRVNRGDCKYNSLNILPEMTVEFRGMQGTFDKDFLEYYLAFNLFFVESAALDSSVHFLPQALKQAYKLRRQDQSPILYSGHEMHFNKEAFDPTQHLSPKQKQYLLTVDQHVSDEMLNTQSEALPDFLNQGKHRAIQNVTLNQTLVTGMKNNTHTFL